MMKIRISPTVIKDLEDIRSFIAEDNSKKASEVLNEIFEKIENLKYFPGIGAKLSKRVSFENEYKYIVWKEYIIIYKIENEFIEIYRVLNRYQDLTRIFQ